MVRHRTSGTWHVACFCLGWQPRGLAALDLPELPNCFSAGIAPRRQGPLVLVQVAGRGSAVMGDPILYNAVNRAAIARLPELLKRWLPDGRRQGQEWVARNPTRHDRYPGSFKVNIATGKWADFATHDKGGDVISLAAFLFHMAQGEAARKLAAMLGVR